MRPKRPRPAKPPDTDSESEYFSSDEDDERYCIPDPNYSGDESEGSGAEESDDCTNDSQNDKTSQKTYSQASKNYVSNNSRLEDKYVYEWVEGEQIYPQNVENSCQMSDANKKKIKSMNCVELFETFFSDSIKNHIIMCTRANGYELTMGELNVFIGILIASAYNSRKSYKHYWSNDPFLSFEPVKAAMARDKFQQIKSNIKYSKPADENENDFGWRVRTIIDLFRENIQQFGYFQAAMAVDEMMAKFYGRTILKQFIKGKPIRFGLKFWGLCTPDGYLLEFDLYCGKNSAIADNKLEKCSLGTRVVMSLLQHFFSNVTFRKLPLYHLYMDNLFTSFDLVLHLKNLGVRSTGTIRENRVKEKNVIPKKSPKGTVAVKYEKSSGINYITLQDSKPVSMVSTAAGVTPTYTAKRRSKEKKEKEEIAFPNAFQLYNKNMGGVDVHDGRCNYAMPCIRSKKWTWIVFIRLIQASIANAVVLSNYVHGKETKKSSSLDFMMAISKHYLSKEKSTRGNHQILTKEKLRKCCFCPIRTRLYCEKCSLSICQNCVPKNNH